MMIARLRPIRSDQMPKPIPPTIAPTFMTAARMPVSVGVEVVLLLEEGRIEVLRAVAEEVERGHQHDDVERDLPVAREFADRIDARLAAPRARTPGFPSTCMRMRKTSSAGAIPTKNMPRQPIASNSRK